MISGGVETLFERQFNSTTIMYDNFHYYENIITHEYSMVNNIFIFVEFSAIILYFIEFIFIVHGFTIVPFYPINNN